MSLKLRYKIKLKFDEMVLNKKVMLVLAILAPLMFTLSALYLGGHFNKIHIPFFEKQKSKITIAAETVVPAEKESAFAQDLQPIFAVAEQLMIPNVKISMDLVEVGLDNDHALATPKDWKQGGWYMYGARPGEAGNMIINAHYDDNYGRPAAFWQLKNISVDDKVLVLDRYGKSYTYSVKDSFLVSINDPDRLKYFDDAKDSSVLTLVTCGGVWLPGQSTYDKRLVVRAELIEE